MTALAILVMLLLAGCSLSPSADFMTALGQDQATSCFTVTTVYGTIKFARSNMMAGGDVNCNDLTLRSTPPGVVVPLVITPSISVGPLQRSSAPGQMTPTGWWEQNVPRYVPAPLQ